MHTLRAQQPLSYPSQMISFDHILVPFDASPSAIVALKTAVELSQKFNSKLTAVYVKKSASDTKVDAIKASLEEHKMAKDIVLLTPTGKMFKEVVKTVEEVEADVVVMGSHGVSGFEEFWIGSNAFRVVSSSPVPVITMQADSNHNGFKRILAPIDQSQETRQKVPHLSHLASAFNAEIELLGTTKYGDEDSQSAVKRYVDQSKKLLANEGLTVKENYILGQNIAKATLDTAAKTKADLIVMMSESEPSSGLFMGSNAQQVVNRSKVPVLTLHPKNVGIVTASGY